MTLAFTPASHSFLSIRTSHETIFTDALFLGFFSMAFSATLDMRLHVDLWVVLVPYHVPSSNNRPDTRKERSADLNFWTSEEQHKDDSWLTSGYNALEPNRSCLDQLSGAPHSR